MTTNGDLVTVWSISFPTWHLIDMMYGSLCTEFYDADKKFATPEEIQFYKSLFEKNEILLEPMCGSGRLLIPLMQEGYTIHGIDNSASMLKSCKERAAKFALKPTLFEANIENIILTNKYDGIIIPLGSFQLFHPRSVAFSMLEKFKTLLKPNGKLILDMYVPWDVLYENHEHISGYREIKIDEYSTIKVDFHNVTDKAEQWIFSTAVYTKLVNQKIVNKETEHMHLNWYYRYEMELILEKYGYKNIKCHNRFLNQEDMMTFVSEYFPD